VKVWVDAQLPPQLCAWLHSEFELDAEPVRSLGLRDAKDMAIFLAAREAGAAIMSKDSDFADLVRTQGPPPQVIWVTCGNTTNRALRRFLGATLRGGLEKLEAGEPLVRLVEVTAPGL
jgi:predicted nuclease of predicted toxin-antitoxin system